MTSAYFKAVTNNHGTILIDDKYRNLAIVGKGTQANTTSAPGRRCRATQSVDIEHTVYTWWDFGYPTSPPASGPRFVLRNEAGQVTFNALLQYARVVDVFSYTQGMPLEKTYAAGKSYAVVVAKRGVRVTQEVRDDPNSVPGTYYNYRRKFDNAMCKVAANVVTADWTDKPWSPINPWSGPLMVIPDPPMDDIFATFIVLDVTGY